MSELNMSTNPESNKDNLPKGELYGLVAQYAREGFLSEVNPLEVLNSQQGMEGTEYADRSNVDPMLLQVGDELQARLSERVLARGELADGQISRAEMATRHDFFRIAVESYEESLLFTVCNDAETKDS